MSTILNAFDRAQEAQDRWPKRREVLRLVNLHAGERITIIARRRTDRSDGSARAGDLRRYEFTDRGGSDLDPQVYGLLPVIDLTLSVPAQRMVNLDGVVSVEVGGEVHRFDAGPPQEAAQQQTDTSRVRRWRWMMACRKCGAQIARVYTKRPIPQTSDGRGQVAMHVTCETCGMQPHRVLYAEQVTGPRRQKEQTPPQPRPQQDVAGEIEDILSRYGMEDLF